VQISDSFAIHAPPETVWRFLFDIERVSQCVPGVESVEVVDAKTYHGRLKVKVGPVTATFGGTATLTEVDPPRRIVAEIEADDRAIASGVKAAFSSTLTPAAGGTEVAYEMTLHMRGRLAQFGGAVVGATAKKMTAEFAQNVRAKLES